MAFVVLRGSPGGPGGHHPSLRLTAVSRTLSLYMNSSIFQYILVIVTRVVFENAFSITFRMRQRFILRPPRLCGLVRSGHYLPFHFHSEFTSLSCHAVSLSPYARHTCCFIGPVFLLFAECPPAYPADFRVCLAPQGRLPSLPDQCVILSRRRAMRAVSVFANCHILPPPLVLSTPHRGEEALQKYLLNELKYK